MFFVPAICCGIGALCGLWKKCARPGWWRRMLLTVCLQYGFLAGLYLIMRRFAAGSEGFLPLPAVCALCFPPYFGQILTLFDRDRRSVRLFHRMGVAAAVLILLEIFLFNGVSLTDRWQSREYEPETLSYSGEADVAEEGLVIAENGVLAFENIPADARCLQLFLRQEEGEQARPLTLTLGMQDGNFTESFPTAAQKRWRGAGDCLFSFRPYGEPVSLKLWFSDMTTPVRLESVTLSNCPPFRFSQLRFWCLFLPAGCLLAVIGFSLYRVRYQRKKWTHLLCVGLTVALCMGVCGMCVKPNQASYRYEGEGAPYDPYALTFDAFQKGQVWLDIIPEEGLADIPNVYSYDQRAASGIYYLWDTAYCNGRYYSYFGITPVLTFYYPYYWLTGNLPDPATPVDFFALGSILLLSLTLLTAVRFFTRRPNLLLLLLSLAAVTLCCGALYTVNDQSPKYQLPLMTGLFWLCGCLLAGMRGYLSQKMPRRMIWLFVSGACLALCFGARPTMAVNAALLIPLFLGILRQKRFKPLWRIGQAACFLLPLTAGGLGLMWYNAARFGSPFDFGAAYQLTVSDVHANAFHFSNLWAAIIHYFLMTPDILPVFPFFGPRWGYMNNYQQYVYQEGVVGWLAYPMVLLGLVWLIPTIRDAKSRRLGASPLQQRCMLLLCWLLPVALALADFSMGGVNQRYLYDIAPLLLIGSTAAILHRCRRPERDKYTYVFSCLAVAATALFGVLLLFADAAGNLIKAYPELYNRVEQLVIFWQ